MLDDVLLLDRKLLIFLNQLGCTQFDQLWLLISHKFTWIPLYLILFILIYRTYKKSNFWMVLAMVGMVFFFTDFMVSQVYRPFFHRLRPCQVTDLVTQLRLVKPSCGGAYGFFSAHAANSFGLATLVGNIFYFKYKKLIYILLAWAALVSYSRVYLGVHYPLDLICGALYGCTISTLAFELLKKLNITAS